MKQDNEKNMTEHVVMKTPPIVSAEEWEAARQQLLVKEKGLTRARDALAAERRRMPWLAVPKKYEFEGPSGKVSLLDLFEGRRQLIVYRAFFEPGVFGWPEHACRGCSFVADQVAHLAPAVLIGVLAQVPLIAGMVGGLDLRPHRPAVPQPMRPPHFGTSATGTFAPGL